MATTSKRTILGSLRQYVKEIEISEVEKAKNVAKVWADWSSNFEMCMKLEEIPAQQWLDIMKVLGGQQLREFMETSCKDLTSYEECKKTMSEAFEERRSINAIRAEFFSTTIAENEDTKAYVSRCRQIAKECEFESFRVEDALLLNLCKHTSHEKLRNEILMQDLKLEQAVKYGASIEMAGRESKKMKRKEDRHQEEERVNRIKKREEPAQRTTKYSDVECGRCGRKNPHTCKARDAECYKCHRKGHFAFKCRTTRSVRQVANQSPVPDLETDVSGSDTDEY